jgi:hypothetical protein
LAWEGEDQSEDDIFFTPLESPAKAHSSDSGSGNGNVVFNNQIHFMYNGAKHVAIVEQLKTHRTSEFFTGTCT